MQKQVLSSVFRTKIISGSKKNSMKISTNIVYIINYIRSKYIELNLHFFLLFIDYEVIINSS